MLKSALSNYSSVHCAKQGGIVLSLAVILLLLSSDSVQAVVTLDTVMIGNAGNANDAQTGYGAIGYQYQIGQYEVTAAQYTEFLNSVAATNTYGLYNTNMWSSQYGCKIQQSGSAGSYTYSVASDYADRPVNFVSWGDATRFTNWLYNGQPTGLQGLSTTEDGSYYLNGANDVTSLMAVTRTANATWVIPSENEWYKAAYHKKDGATGNYWDYPTQVDSPTPGRDLTEAMQPGNNANHYGTPYPIDSGTYYTTKVGEFELSRSAYGTFDQAGNIYEWNQAAVTGTTRGIRGAGFGSSANMSASERSNFDPLTDRSDFGFRVAVANVPTSTWKVGTPIVTFWGGHTLDSTIAQRDVAGGYNQDYVSSWTELAVAEQYGLRARLRSDWYLGNLLWPESLDGGVKQAQLNALIDQYKVSPAAYAYYITDEPSTQAKVDYWAPLIAYVRTRDPDHLSQVSMGAPNWVGDTVWKYYLDTVHPQMIVSANYNLSKDGNGANYDEPYYLSNLGKIAGWAKEYGVPFMHIVQACGDFDATWRVPTGNEMRFLTTSTLAYGAQGIDYFNYYTNYPNRGGIEFNGDGTPTQIYTALAKLNPEFVEVVKQYSSLTHVGTYLKGYSTRPSGTEALPGGAPFTLPNVSDTKTYATGAPLTGMLMGFFGPDGVLANATRMFLANLDYSQGVTTTVNGPSYDMATFNATTKTWTLTGANHVSVTLPPGGGVLVGVGAITANGGDTIDIAGNTVTQAVTINGMGAGGNGALRNSGTITGGGAGLTVTLAGNSAMGVTGDGGLNVGDVSGDYSLTKVGSGSGILNLMGTSTYTGGTIINAGNLKFNSTSAIPSTGDILINSGGGLVVSGAYTTVMGWLNSGKIDTASTGTLGLAVASSAEAINMGSYTNLSLGSCKGPYDYTYSGTMTPANNVYRFGGGGGTLIVSSTLSGERSLVTSGNVILTGSNSYTGGTTVNAGYLKFSSTSALPDTGNILINSGGSLVVSGAYTTVTNWLNSGKIDTASTGALALAVASSAETINMGSYTNLSLGSAGPFPYTYSGTMTPANNVYRFGGGGGTLIVSSVLSGTRSLVTSGNVTLTGDNTYTGATTINAGTLQIGNSGTAGTLGTGSVTNNAALTFNRSDAYTASNAISGSGNLTQAGAGRLTLSGTNTYTGATTVSAGTLAISGSGSINATSDITLDGGTLLQNSSTALDRTINFISGTFGGTGTYAGNLSPLSVHLAPGDGGIGTTTIAGSLTLYADGVLDYDFGTTAGTSDLVAFSGDYGYLVLDGTININCSGTLPAGQYTIFSGAWVIEDNGLVFGNVPVGHNYSYTIVDGSVVIVTVAPEPGTLVLLSVGLLSLMVCYAWRKRR